MRPDIQLSPQEATAHLMFPGPGFGKRLIPDILIDWRPLQAALLALAAVVL